MPINDVQLCRIGKSYYNLASGSGREIYDQFSCHVGRGFLSSHSVCYIYGMRSSKISAAYWKGPNDILTVYSQEGRGQLNLCLMVLRLRGKI
eukprot:scaffold9374_cov91-Skeletonema_menzelii.AAC.1